MGSKHMYAKNSWYIYQLSFASKIGCPPSGLARPVFWPHLDGEGERTYVSSRPITPNLIKVPGQRPPRPRYLCAGDCVVFLNTLPPFIINTTLRTAVMSSRGLPAT